jgi:hypothetical protein
MIDSEIEYRLVDIEAISELMKAYIEYYSNKKPNLSCISFLSENLQKNIEEINAILRNDSNMEHTG